MGRVCCNPNRLAKLGHNAPKFGHQWFEFDAHRYCTNEGQFYGKNSLKWGATVQGENIYDRYKEWQRIDSAGYSLPYTQSTLDSVSNGRLYSTPYKELELFSHVSSSQTLKNYRAKAFVNFKGKKAFANGEWTYNIR